MSDEKLHLIGDDDWFAICEAGLTYVGEFKCFEDAYDFCGQTYGHPIWQIDGKEARRWIKVLTTKQKDDLSDIGDDV